MSRIIAAFSGVGKSHFCNLYPNALDMVIMPFKYCNLNQVSEGAADSEAIKAHEALELRADWRDFYYHALTDTYRRYPGEVIVIPTEAEILRRLEQDDIPFTVVYPHHSLKEEYRQRYLARGNTVTFLDVFIGGWDGWMERVRRSGGTHMELQSGQFLSDVIQPPSSTSGIVENKATYISDLIQKMDIEHCSDFQNLVDAI